MTEYTEEVNLQRLKNDAEEWGKKVAYIHYNNGIEETKYNNGRLVKKNVATGHVDHFSSDRTETLIDKFQKAMSDQKTKLTREYWK